MKPILPPQQQRIVTLLRLGLTNRQLGLQLGYNLSALAQLIELIPSVLQRKEAELESVEAEVQAFSEKHGFQDSATLPEPEDQDDEDDGEEADSESEAEEIEFASEPVS